MDDITLASGQAAAHDEREDHGWCIEIPDHPPRRNSPEYERSRAKLRELAESVSDLYYGPGPHQDHHGGGLWLKDDGGWFLVKNLAGIEWSAQFCADPAKVDQLRLNARRLYAAFPEAAEELGIRELLDTPITSAGDIARWTDSICNASVPLPAGMHSGVLPHGGGVHHYPTPVTDIETFKRDDFDLWVTDADGRAHAVVPVAPRGSGDSRARILWSPSESSAHAAGGAAGEAAIVLPDHPLAAQAFARQRTGEEAA